MICDLEIFIDDVWQKAAIFTSLSDLEVQNGFKGAGFFEYDVNYVAKYLNHNAFAQVSMTLPIGFAINKTITWPAFLLDILPSGNGRRVLLNQFNLRDGPLADWPLLLNGASNPPGNLRIAQAVMNTEHIMHPGFDYQEITERADYFIEYARSHGAPVAGSSGAQGDAPKFLLTQDHHNKWHADGALTDSLAKKHWLVKFPRGRHQSDRKILRNEAAYYRVAQDIEQITTGKSLQYSDDALFIPRFDRQFENNKLIRYGLESLCALAGVADFGQPIPQEQLCKAIASYTTEPQKEITEFIFRDVLNVAMGNTDNHARNTAVIKRPDGNVSLAPLFDFAPMILDRQGIARTCRWTNAEEAGRPIWGKVAEQVKSYRINSEDLRNELADFSTIIKRLPDRMKTHGVDDDLIEYLTRLSKYPHFR